MATKKTAYPFRTRFAGDIVAEILMPERQTGKVAIFCSGLPSSTNKRGVLEFLASHGYVAIFPRYRGTWESQGNFLEHSPADDVRDTIDDLVHKKGFIDIATSERISIQVSSVHLFGSSFGGPAVLMNSHLPIVKKVVAISPVLDWKEEGEDEPFDFFVHFTREAFGDAFRTKHTTDWQKLIKTDFYNPVAHTKTIAGKKIMIIHAKDDMVVPHTSVIPFSEKTGTSYYLKPHGGHNIDFRHLFLWKKIDTFLKKR